MIAVLRHNHLTPGQDVKFLYLGGVREGVGGPGARHRQRIGAIGADDAHGAPDGFQRGRQHRQR